MIKIRRAEDRGHANYGWLDTYHSFSFADYHDPQHVQFRSLRVLNEDTVQGGGGFDLHPHRDMEIISYILSGALRHRDSMGNTAVLKVGDVQRISAGTGIEHSEFNDSPDQPVHFLQIWLLPQRRGLTPSYAERSFANAPKDRWNLVASKSGFNGSLSINQDVAVYLALLSPEGKLTYELKPQRHAWIQVAEGDVKLNGSALNSGDGAAVSGEKELILSAGQESKLLLFDLN